ncbi:MAG: hypothetical protein FJZ67_03455, partial [Bacteroidetes bacterium]|nr:hypothetical protein [Bacteroidota bacterium]
MKQLKLSFFVILVKNDMLKSKLLFILIGSLLALNYTFGQVTAADCSNAVNICQNANFAIDPNGPGAVADFQSGTVSNPST